MMLSTTRPAFLPHAIGCGEKTCECLCHRFGGRSTAAWSITNRVPFLALTFRRSCDRKVKVRDSARSGNRIPSSDPSPVSWKLWLVGGIVSAALAFWKKNWMPFLRIKKLVKEAEEVAGKIEEVAEEVEKVAAEVAEELPKGGKLRDEVMFAEKVAKETAEEAHLAHQVFDKVEEVEEKVESFVDQANESAQEAARDGKNQN